MAEHFDLDQVARNWELLANPERERPVGPLAAVKAPLDFLVAAREELVQIRALIVREAPEKAETLDHFLRRAEAAVTQLDEAIQADGRALAAAREAAAAAGAGKPPPGPALSNLTPLRSELHEALFDLEDLLEVVLFIMKKGDQP